MLKEVIEAVAGLLLTLLAVMAGTKFYSLSGKVDDMAAEFSKCREARQICQEGMRRHHEDAELHRSSRDTNIVEDILERLKRIEGYLMKIAANGSGK